MFDDNADDDIEDVNSEKWNNYLLNFYCNLRKVTTSFRLVTAGVLNINMTWGT